MITESTNQLYRVKLNPSNLARGVGLVIGLCLAVSFSSHGATITKTNNADALNLTSSWVGGAVPTSIDVARWDSTVTGANTVDLGATANWAGIQILNPGGLVTIKGPSGAYQLNLGASGIDMSSATANLTLAPTATSLPLSLVANQTWNIGTGRTLTISFNFVVQNNRTLTLTNSGNFSTIGWMQVSAAGSPGTFNHNGGTWSSGVAGTMLFLGHSGNAMNPGVGVYNLNGGTIAMTGSQELRLGNQTAAGDGTLNVTNGAITSSATTTLLRVGYVNGSKGIYNQSGGTVTVGVMDIAANNTVGAGATGVATNSGGVLNVTTLNIGTKQNGSFTLNNSGRLNLLGTATVGGAAGSSGTLNLLGGTLNIASTTANALTAGATGIVNANGVAITNGSSGNVTVAAPMTLGAGGITSVKLATTSGRNITFTGNLGGSGGVTVGIGGLNNLHLKGTNSFAGPITITDGYFHNSGVNGIPTGCALTNNAQWALDNSATLGSLEGNGSIFRNASQGAATLTAGYNDADGNYSGYISENTGSQLSLTKIGSGTLTLSGTCGYTGNTTVSNGTLLVNGNLTASYVDVQGGTLGGIGTIGNSVNLASGVKAMFTNGGKLTIAGSLTASGNPIHLSLSSNVPPGYYLLATCAGGAIGAFAPTPVIASGSFAAGTTNYFISTPTDGQVWLTVQGSFSDTLPAPQFTWPSNQFLPTFATNAAIIDCIDVSSASNEERDLFASLQGIVNRSQPRIACVSSAAAEGKFTWLTNHNLSYRMSGGYNLIRKYSYVLAGVVVPDPDMPDTLNLATTIAGVTNALICDPSLLDLLTNAPFSLPVKADLRGLFNHPNQVYGYLYSNYWSQCTHRIITGMRTNIHGYSRDYVVAVKSACVWLDPTNATDAPTLRLFMTNMTPVGGVWMGWVPTEGPDVKWLAQFGIPVLASDFLQNGTLYSGVPSAINVPPIPAKPTLQSKIYVSFLLSDGDNVQYMQHRMRANWDDPDRGSVPIGWTTTSLACDIDPGMLNYYWRTATTNDCLISGPSGAGYTKMDQWSNSAYVDAFTKASAPYLQKAGHRVITVWNQLSVNNAKYYGTNCPNLLGLISHQGGYFTSTNYGKIPTIGLPTYQEANYGDFTTNLLAGITNTAAGWSGSSPMFIPVQGVGWQVTPSDLLSLATALGTNYVVVRPDHLFQLYYSPANTNAALASLVISPAGTLSPAFATNVFAYAATNAYLNNPVTVIASSVDPGATLRLRFNGGAYGLLTNGVPSGTRTLILDPPTNSLAVQVVSPDLTRTNTYTVNLLLQPSLIAPALTNSVSGTTLTLSWAADHLGYRLLMQTNNLNKGVSGNLADWGTAPGSTTITTTNITIPQTNVSGFYRLVYP
jgi:autotransporter-associated beta strand protein